MGVTLNGAAAAFAVASETQIALSAPPPSALGQVAVVVQTLAGTSNAGSFSYVETSPPALTAPVFAFSIVPYAWSFGGPASDAWFLVASTSTATFPFGAYDILAQHDLVLLGGLDALGLGSASIAIPSGFAGLTFHSQLLTWDGGVDLQATSFASATILG